MFSFDCTELLIFYGHHLLLQRCSCRTFNIRGFYNFITKKANIPLILVPFFNGVSLLFCRFLKPGVTNELESLSFLKSKKVRIIYSKQDKTLLLVKRQFGQHVYGEPLQLHFFYKRVIMSQIVISIKFALFKEMAVQGARFSFPVNFNN